MQKNNKGSMIGDNMTKLKHTYEEVKLEFENKEYTLLSKTYEGVSKKLEYTCNKHPEYGVQKITFSKFHSCNQGCKQCGIEKSKESRKIDFDYQADKQLALTRNFEYKDTVRINGIIYIKFICFKHRELGIQIMCKKNMERDIKGCQYCAGKNLPKDYVIDRMNTVNPNIELLGEYINLTTSIQCRCKIHNIIHNKTPQAILKGKGCVECGKEKLRKLHTRSTEIVQEKVSARNPHIDLIDEYDGDVENIQCYCTKHDQIFTRHLSTLTDNQSGCNKCYGEFIREKHGIGIGEFKRRLREIHPELEVIGEYKTNSTPIKVTCMIHNYTYSSTPSALFSRLSCCAKTRITYKEERVCRLLEDWGYNITRQKKFEDCRDVSYLYFDCYLDDFNILIEFDGEQHYKPVKYSLQSYDDAVRKYEYTKMHDLIKDEYCRMQKIELIRIPYWEFENLDYFLFNELVKFKAIDEIKSVA